jgi:hypothetical protein
LISPPKIAFHVIRSISRYSHRYFRWRYTDPEREQAADQNPAGRDRRARARAAFGTKSKQSLSDLCFGKQAKVTPRVKDLYGRTWHGSTAAGLMQILNRSAAVWLGYIDSTPRITISIFLSRRQSGSSAACGPTSRRPRHGIGERRSVMLQFR